MFCTSACGRLCKGLGSFHPSSSAPCQDVLVAERWSRRWPQSSIRIAGASTRTVSSFLMGTPASLGLTNLQQRRGLTSLKSHSPNLCWDVPWSRARLCQPLHVRVASPVQGRVSGAPFAAARLWTCSRPFNKRKTLESHLFLFSIFPVTVQITSTGAVVWISVSNRNAPNFAAALCVVSRSLGLVWEGGFGALGWGWGSAGLGSLGCWSCLPGPGERGGDLCGSGDTKVGWVCPQDPSTGRLIHEPPSTVCPAGPGTGGTEPPAGSKISKIGVKSHKVRGKKPRWVVCAEGTGSAVHLAPL